MQEKKSDFKNCGRDYLKTVSAAWKAMSTEEKRPFIDKSNAEKGRYLEYLKKNP